MGVADLPDDLQEKIAKWESNKPANRSVVVLEDIASMIEDIGAQMEKRDKNDDLTKLGVLLMDIREHLSAIEAKEDPETPDYSKPVVNAVQGLEKALTAALDNIDMKPEFKPSIKVDAPSVSVEAPTIDLSNFEKILKTDIPKAFAKAIQSIPTTEIPPTDLEPVIEKMAEISEKLDSIDTATRMKPLPGSIKINNTTAIPVTDGFLAAVNYDYIDVQQTSGTVETFVYKLGGSGGTTVRTIVVTYTSSGKTDIDSVVYS